MKFEVVSINKVWLELSHASHVHIVYCHVWAATANLNSFNGGHRSWSP